MESYLPISFLNDFIFCPRSIYCHQLYRYRSYRTYQSNAQVEGKAAHEAIDSNRYSTSKHIFQAIDVYSEKYRLGGKIDTFDANTGLLTERKKKIKIIYDGYVFQLYAQYFCLKEMGYKVKRMRLYSMDDNKSYEICLPSENAALKKSFTDLLKEIRTHDIGKSFQPVIKKCRSCIYSAVCDFSLC